MPPLEEWIDKARVDGHPDHRIKNKLLEHGYEHEHIQHHFKEGFFSFITSKGTGFSILFFSLTSVLALVMLLILIWSVFEPNLLLILPIIWSVLLVYHIYRKNLFELLLTILIPLVSLSGLWTISELFLPNFGFMLILVFFLLIGLVAHYLLSKTDQMLKLGVILSSIVSIACAANLFIFQVLSHMDKHFESISESSLFAMDLWIEDLPNPWLIFILAQALFNAPSLIYDRDFRKECLWYLVPIGIFLVLAPLMMLLAKAMTP